MFQATSTLKDKGIQNCPKFYFVRSNTNRCRIFCRTFEQDFSSICVYRCYFWRKYIYQFQPRRFPNSVQLLPWYNIMGSVSISAVPHTSTIRFRSRSLVLENIFWNISTEFDCAGLSKFYLWYWGTNCKFVALLSILSLFAVGTASSHITKITNLSYMYRCLSIDGADFANVQICFGLLW